MSKFDTQLGNIDVQKLLGYVGNNSLNMSLKYLSHTMVVRKDSACQREGTTRAVLFFRVLISLTEAEVFSKAVIFDYLLPHIKPLNYHLNTYFYHQVIIFRKKITINKLNNFFFW